MLAGFTGKSKKADVGLFFALVKQIDMGPVYKKVKKKKKCKRGSCLHVSKNTSSCGNIHKLLYADNRRIIHIFFFFAVNV